MSGDPIDRLGALDDSTTSPLDADRLAAIEARVMAAVVDDRRIVGVAPHASRRRPAVLVAAAACIVLLVVAVALAAAGRGAESVVLAFADGVTLEQSAGSSSALTAGDELEDGAVVVIASGGSARVGDRTFGPGWYLVADATLRRLDAATVSTPTNTTAPAQLPVPPVTTAAATTTRAPSATRVAPTTVARAPTEPSTTGSRATTTTVPITQPPTTVAATRPPTTSTRPPSGTTVAPARSPAPPETRSTTTTTTTTTEVTRRQP